MPAIQGKDLVQALNKEVRQSCILSLQKYFQQNMEEPLGNLPANALLDYFLEELGPLLYNKGVADAQAQLQQRVSELDYEVHAEAFQFWRAAEKPGRGRR